MRLKHLLLLALVAVNLTLVCQGHETKSHREGLHIALLGEVHSTQDEQNEHDEHNDAGGKPSYVEQEPSCMGAVSATGRTKLPIQAVFGAGRTVTQLLPGAPELPTLITLPTALLAEREQALTTTLCELERQDQLPTGYKEQPEVPPPRTVPA